MDILWISGRRMGYDLASSTEYYLSKYLTKLGHKITLLSPGELKTDSFEHRILKDFVFPGLTSFTGALDVKKKLKSIREDMYDVILVDWRYVYMLRNILPKLTTPWLIIDRGPPAGKAPLEILQKYFWKWGWKIAKYHSMGGTVVSDEHKSFVNSKIGFNKRINIIPAGSYPNPNLRIKKSANEVLRLAYVGTLDRKRGVRKILDLADGLEKIDRDYEIHICGSGDSSREFLKGSENNENLLYHGKISHEDTMHILASCHVGIMPMPDDLIWRIASPLKLAEYLASGLLIIGTDHPGNRVIGNSTSFHMDRNDWVRSFVSLISNSNGISWNEVMKSSLELSESLSWEEIAYQMSKDIAETVLI